MIIDDSDVERYLLKRYLQKTNLVETIIEINNGTDGLAQLDQLQSSEFPEIIFLDLNMPLMSGFEFLEELKNKQKIKISLDATSIYVVSSSENDKDILKATQNEFVNGFYVKGKFNFGDIKCKSSDLI